MASPLNKTHDIEFVIGNRQVLAGFAILSILFGIFFAAGYIAGHRSKALRQPAAATLEEPEPDRVPTEVEYIRIAAGEFVMGYTRRQDDALFERIERNLGWDLRPEAVNDCPAHRVRITRGFEIGKYEVSQGQWSAVMGSAPERATRSDYPVEYVSWNDVRDFLRRLNARGDGYRYRLPTEAEWEYAARAGTRGRETDGMYADAWDFSPGTKGISIKRPVDTGVPNAWGLYWMLGNVAEWCQDWYGPRYYRNSAIANPQGPRRGRRRIARGGGANYVSFTVFVWSRDASDPAERQDSVGFRLVREKAAIR